MCAVSMILDHGQKQWDQLQQWPLKPQQEYWKQWLELIQKAKEYDKKTNQPNCEDAAKLPILDRILKRLDEIEKKLS